MMNRTLRIVAIVLLSVFIAIAFTTFVESVGVTLPFATAE